MKLEILGPVDAPWSSIKPRLFALRKTAAQALNMAMQEHHADAMGELRAFWLGQEPKKGWRGEVYKTLGRCWNEALAREASFRGHAEEQATICAAIKSDLTVETVDNILARFNGEHQKDLIRGDASFPSFASGCAFYARASSVAIGGSPSAARVSFPLWGSGKSTTQLSVAPCGGSAVGQWRKLVADFGRRAEVATLEGQLRQKGVTGEKRKSITRQLEAMSLTKLGRIGIKFDERRRKWFALVSYTQHRPDNYKEGQKASLNFGVNVFAQAVAEDGAEWHEAGDQILSKRIAEASIRKRIQRSMRTFGSGSKGRGKARRELPLTKRQGSESRFVETYIRQLSAQVISWCRRHGVSDLYLEDLGGIRESFERATEGEAHPEVKRRIHHWPYYQSAQAIERQGSEFGIRVHTKSAHYNSQRCPDCGHVDPENIQEVRVPGMPILFRESGRHAWRSGPRAAGGAMYRRDDKTWRFSCTSCGKRGQADMVACMNMLISVGATFGGKPTPFQKAQEAAKKAVSSDKRKKVRRTGS